MPSCWSPWGIWNKTPLEKDGFSATIIDRTPLLTPNGLVSENTLQQSRAFDALIPSINGKAPFPTGSTNTMKKYARTRVYDFLGDAIVFRSLEPVKPELPGLNDLRSVLNLPLGKVPRKTTTEYARVIVHILQIARPGLERVVYLGDTRLNDGTAFVHICQAGGWSGLAFIAAERNDPPQTKPVEAAPGIRLHLANRWAALADFQAYCNQYFPIDEKTVVMVDLDKTTMGARGRNDKVIDRVRLEAAFQTGRDLLGGAFDSATFEHAYRYLNQTKFHPFTTDNQDYLVYVCLMLGSGLIDLEGLEVQIASGRTAVFEDFLAFIGSQQDNLPPTLQEVHRDVAARLAAGDPTPFKAFRRHEYLATVSRMGQLDENASVEQALAEEIVITQEVRTAALAWKEQGALLFGLSDKPDEASIPTPELAAQGAQPIHKIETDTIGV